MNYFSEEDYQEIIKLKDRAMLCSSKKDAEEYINRIKFIGDCVNTTPAMRISSLCSALRNYCNRNNVAEQEKNRLLIAHDISVLRGMIDR